MGKELFALIAEAVKSPTVAWRLIVTLIVGVHIAWACGWLPGIQGFALAAEVDDETTTIKSRLTAIETKQDIALRIALADEICRLYALRDQSVSQPTLWRTLNDTFNDRQEDYAAINSGREYDVSQCSASR